jgi:toxin ParE1/3/4
MKVRHSALAEDDLIEIWLYVATENPDAADRLLDRFERHIRLLAT